MTHKAYKHMYRWRKIISGNIQASCTFVRTNFVFPTKSSLANFESWGEATSQFGVLHSKISLQKLLFAS